ncbi:Broad specificity phosphatase PhoE [Mariprofundus aestuarium]|uniref:Broad specificity phosphatase PhoE n=1 Tax=Mariprofundus aestuarium TaxID=1921086 RepID=A0A2K8KYM6_MARES|nr:histidine phosphatase family protein [Mariprofundus aestuarium]ATX80085.1 Broad specificity phosphatase PhoE [Mariprofundus aestuarium]
MISRIAIMIVLISSLFSIPAYAGDFSPLNIYFARHGETLGNLTHKHTHFNDRTFSDDGVRQVEELTAKLGEIKFDHILVSPVYRAMNTVFPYLRKHNLKAEIWPELAECCWQKERNGKASHLSRGSSIKVEADMQPYFIFADKSDSREFKARDYADGIFMVTTAFERVVKNYSGSGKAILIVGHYHSGGRLIELLQRLYPEGNNKLSNGKITQLQENPDGSFNLIASNY